MDSDADIGFQQDMGTGPHDDDLALVNESQSDYENANGDPLERLTELERGQTDIGMVAYHHSKPEMMDSVEKQQLDHALGVTATLDNPDALYPSENQMHDDMALNDNFQIAPEHDMTGSQYVETGSDEFQQQYYGFLREFQILDDQEFDQLLDKDLPDAEESTSIQAEKEHSDLQNIAVEPESFEKSATDIGDPLEYAYANELVRDHRLVSFSVRYLLDPAVENTLRAADGDGFPDYNHLVELEVPTIVVTGNVKTIETSQDALKLISEARKILSDSELEELTLATCKPTSVELARLELPLLRSDNEWDLRQYQRENAGRHAALLESIKNHNLPLDTPDSEKGEGVEPSPQVRKECEELWRQMEEAERLVVTKDSLMYLAGQIKDDYTKEDWINYLMAEIKYNKDMSLQKLTPPASPKLGKDHSEPVFDHSVVPIPSDSVDSVLSDNFQAIEDEIFADSKDEWSENTSPIRQSIVEEFSSVDPTALIELPRKKLEDFKIEVPLMANVATQRLPPSGATAFQGFIKGVDLALDPTFEEAILNGSWNEELQLQTQKGAEMVLKAIEQEQLQAIDAIGRVPIPVLDFAISEPEWKRLRSKPNAIFKWIQGGNEQLFKLPPWPRDRFAESKMIWQPIAAGAVCEPQAENMDDGESRVENLLKHTSTSEVISSANFVTQRNRLAILDLDDGDEEIETQLQKRNPHTDIINLVKKRVATGGSKMPPMKKPRRALEQTTLDHMTKSPSSRATGPSLLAGDSPGASAKLLSNFMELQAPKKKTWTSSKYFASVQSSSARPETPELEPKGMNLFGKAQKKPQKPDMMEQPALIAPCPGLRLPSGPVCIFISITVPRRMFRALEGVIPGLTIIERDYDAHNTFLWRGPGSVNRVEVVPSLANDADITVSPSIGVIVTSMIKIRQRPTEEGSKNVEQARLEKASLRYERLIVLVGSDAGDDTLSEMTASDATALTELQGFVTGLDCNVQVLYVGGGNKALWQWIATCICRHALVEPVLLGALLEVETLWELFLRRAGFNVFAAQVIAGQLKSAGSSSKGGYDGSTTSMTAPEGGLGTFMTMTRAERMRKFGQLVGPRVLERVGKAVDELWNRS